MSIPIECGGCGKKYRVKDEKAGKTVKCKICGRRLRIPEPLDDPLGQIVRHDRREHDFELAVGDNEAIEAISNHFESFVGKVDKVFHEIVSDLVHVDIHHIPAGEGRPYQTLFTTGMSDRPMTVPDEIEISPYAELLVCLPPEWPMTEKAFEQEENYWPVRWLKILARLPHEYDTWLGYGHTVPNGDPPEPFADNTRFCCTLLLPPTIAGENFAQLKLTPRKVVNFFSMFVLYPDEVKFKLKHGAEALEERFQKAGVTEVINLRRPSVCKRTVR